MKSNRNLSVEIASIFSSIQGESTSQGERTSFIRMARCNLNCTWCDTRWSHQSGKVQTIEAVMNEIKTHKTKFATVTGGEPLLHSNTIDLLLTLLSEGYETSIETNGSMDISSIPLQVRTIVDLKCPDSGMAQKNRYSNMEVLKPIDEVKFVLSSERDYKWAVQQIKKFHINRKCKVLMSPVTKGISPKQLAEFILRDYLPVRMNLQLHKYIWEGDENEH